MSWYTYIKPKKDFYDGFTLERLNSEIDTSTKFIKELRTFFKGYMIHAYYESPNNDLTTYYSIRTKLNQIYNYEKMEALNCYRRDILSKDKYRYNKSTGHLIFNHADTQQTVENTDEYKDRIISDMCILSYVKFKKGDVEEDTEMDYLRYSYQKEIDELIDNLLETAVDAAFATLIEGAEEVLEEDKYYEKYKYDKE